MKDIVRLRIPTPFEVGPTNVYLIKSDPITLIDTGPNTESAKKALLKALSDEGVSMNDIKRVLITHAHSDHSGLAGWLEMQSAQIYIHPDEGRKLTGINLLPLRETFLQQMGTPPDKIKSFHASAKTNLNASVSAFTPLQEGDIISFNDFTLTVIETPGHCGGHISFFYKEAECLFGGDAVLNHITPNPLPELYPHLPGIRSKSLSAMLSTLVRLDNLRVQWVLPGHGETVLNLSDRIQVMQKHHSQRLEQINTSLTERKTPFSLAANLYKNLNGWDVFLAVAEVCAHLDLLTERGLVKEILQDKISYFEQIK
ncbi:MAG: MBL fold metallo-hydrolase [Firmicutes bacterium]|nr:MBL fold metallo-hydrolase [Bacillota bacterium]